MTRKVVVVSEELSKTKYGRVRMKNKYHNLVLARANLKDEGQ